MNLDEEIHRLQEQEKALRETIARIDAQLGTVDLADPASNTQSLVSIREDAAHLLEQTQRQIAALEDIVKQRDEYVQEELTVPEDLTVPEAAPPPEAPQLGSPLERTVQFIAMAVAAYTSSELGAPADLAQAVTEKVQEVVQHTQQQLDEYLDRRVEPLLDAHQQPEQAQRENAVREMARQEDLQREQLRQEHQQEREALEKNLALAQERFNARVLEEQQRAELQRQLDERFAELRERLERQQREELERQRAELERRRELDPLQL